MRRWIALLAVVAVGCTASQAETSESSNADELAEASQPTTSRRTTSALAGIEPGAASSTTITEPDGPIIVVVPSGIPDEFLEQVGGIAGVNQVALIQSGSLQMVESRDAAGEIVDQPASGFVIPIAATIFDRAPSAGIFSPELASALEPVAAGELLLSESSAALRRLTVGGSMTFDDGSTFRVAVVAPDAIAGTTEAILVGTDPLPLPIQRRRAAVVDFDGNGVALEVALAELYADTPFRVFDRSGAGRQDRQRATLPQIVVKEIFGEFAYRPVSAGRIEIDPAWIETNVITSEVPLLGEVKCHRIYVDILTDVMQSLVDDGLEEVIDRGAFQGCWNPRFIAGSTRLSRHAWGIAADINFGNALDGGPGSPVNQELLDRMAALGVTSGHRWTVPDPGHFEYVTTAP